MSELGLWGPGAELAWRTIVVGAVVNTACALLGCYLVLRRMSLLGDAISHAVLPGIVVAFLFAGRTSPVPLFLGAMATGMLTSLFIQTLNRYGGVNGDAAMGIVFTALFSIGVILLSKMAHFVDLDPSCVLYGNIEYVSVDLISIKGYDVPRVLPTMLGALVAVLLFIAVFWKELKLSTFDPALATAMGFSATLLHYLLMGMTAVVTVSAFEAVGSILSVAMLIVPGATASLLTDKLSRMLVWSAAVATASSLLGYVGAAAFHTNAAGMMAVAAGLQFSSAVLFAPRYGLLSKAYGAAKLKLRIAGEDLAAALYRDEESGALPRRAGIASADLLRRAGDGAVARFALRRLVQRGNLHAPTATTIALTEQGRAAAASLVRSHRLWEAYLVENFQLPLDHLHAPAEKIEHFIGPELQKQLAESLPASHTDPHGREIPPERSK